MTGQPRRWRYRLRTLLVAVIVIGLGFGWLDRHLRRERDQVALVAELNQAGIYAFQYEPNTVGRVLRVLPMSAQQWLVPRRLRWTFCYSPSGISAFTIRDDTVPYLIDRMRRLPYLRSVSLQHGQISPEAEQWLRQALPRAEMEVDPHVGVFPCRSLSCERCRALRNDLANPGPSELWIGRAHSAGPGIPSGATDDP
jgi:hypothetical protein